MERLNIKIEKYSLPIIWLDTSIFINLGKIAAGRKFEEHVMKRLTVLKDTIIKKVKEHKLICAEADQEEEIELWKGQLKPIQTILSQLSQGVLMRHRKDIENFQIYRLMEAYLKQSAEVTLSTKEIFYDDPIKEIESHEYSPYIIRSVATPPKHLIDESIASKKRKREVLEKLRLSNVEKNISFEQQFLNEQNGHILSYVETLQKHLVNPDFIFEDNFFHLKPLFIHLSYWKLLTEKEADIEGFIAFLNSEYYKVMPVVTLECLIYADLLTGQKPIDDGDSMDVQQLSSVIPYSDFILTDASKRHLLKTRKVNKNWGTKIFSFDESEKLVAELETL